MVRQEKVKMVVVWCINLECFSGVGAVACSTDSGWEGHGKDMNGIYFFNFKVKILRLFLTVTNLNFF
jgi:hypothetical protein